MKTLATAVLIGWVSILSAQDITGQWNGTLDVQGTPLSVIFNIDTSENGLVSTMDSPDQGATGIPTSKTILEDNELTIELEDMAIAYQGVFSAEDSTIAGTFTQGSMAMPLVLTRKAVEKKMAVRPQDPATFPYLQEEVSFVNQEGHRLAGTLTMPQDFPTGIRINRQQIINLTYVQTINPWFSDTLKVTLHTGEALEVSRRQSSKLKKLFSL